MFSTGFQTSPWIGRTMGHLALASALVFATGCSLTGSATPGMESDAGGGFSGTVYGGQNALIGATISLWAAGSTGYGSGSATPLATTTTDANGSFSFPATGTGSYTCPGTNPLMYVTAQGGDSGGGVSNSAIALMAVLGGPNNTGVSQSACNAVKLAKPFININEVTTVASIFALQQFFNPVSEATGVPSIGTSSTNAQGLINAFNVAGSMLNLTSGSVNATYQAFGSATIAGSQNNITVTTESSKINLMANILASCVNTTGPGSTLCVRLFQDAVPPPTPGATARGASVTFPTANDTLLAAYYLATNPINAVTAGVPDTAKTADLYGMETGTPPFFSSAAQPTDWTLGLTYSSSVQNGTPFVLSAPSNLSIDASGDLWFLTNGTQNLAITELNPYGGLIATSLSSITPLQGLAFDSAGFAYTARPATKIVYALKPGVVQQANAAPQDATNSNAAVLASAFAADATSVFFPQLSTGKIFQLPAVGQSGTPFVNTTTTNSPQTAVNSPNPISGLTASSGIAVDRASHIWVAGTSSNTLYEIGYPSTTATPVSFAGGAFNLPTGVAIDHANNAWVINGIGGSPANGFVTEVPSATSAPVQDTTAGDGGINNPAGIAIDGAGNVWVSSAGQTVSGTAFTGQTVSELALVGGTITPLSPSVGFAHTYTGPGSIAIDASGNVWVANAGGIATSTVPGSITEILGAAVPVATPIALAVKNNTLGILP